MNWRWRLVLYVVCVGLVLVVSGCSVAGLPALVRRPLDLTILHTGQVYGEIVPCG